MAELRERAEAGRLPPVLLVHMGTPEDGASFFAERWPEARAVSDASKQLYAAFGLTPGSLGQLFGARVFLAGLDAAMRGHGIGRPVGDPMMMSGWFLVDGPSVLWEHVHEHAGAPRSWDELERVRASASGERAPAT